MDMLDGDNNSIYSKTKPLLPFFQNITNQAVRMSSTRSTVQSDSFIETKPLKFGQLSFGDWRNRFEFASPAGGRRGLFAHHN